MCQVDATGGDDGVYAKQLFDAILVIINVVPFAVGIYFLLQGKANHTLGACPP